MTDKTLEAYEFAKKKHKGQKDDTGKDYFTAHCERVAMMLGVLNEDNNDDLLSAALLHDTLEDTDTTYEELKEKFGHKVADLVNEVTQEGDKSKGFYFPRLHSKKGIMIKFADRLSNISRMESWSKDRQDHYLKKSKFWRSE